MIIDMLLITDFVFYVSLMYIMHEWSKQSELYE